MHVVGLVRQVANVDEARVLQALAQQVAVEQDLMVAAPRNLLGRSHPGVAAHPEERDLQRPLLIARSV